MLNHAHNPHANCQVSSDAKILANTCISYDSSGTLTSWPVTPLVNFMACNDFKFFNKKTDQQIRQSFLNAT